MRFRLITIQFYLFLSSFAQNCNSQLETWDKTTQFPFEQRKANLYKIISTQKLTDSCIANAYRRLGTLYHLHGISDSAIYFYKEAQKFSLKANDVQGQASNLRKIAGIYCEHKNYQLALHYFRLTFDIYAIIPHEKGMSDTYLKMAEILFNQNKADLARALCLQSLGYMRRWGDTATVGYNYDLLSKIELTKNQVGRALRYSNTAVFLLRKDHDYPGLLPALAQTAKVFTKLSRPDSSIIYLNEAYRLARSLNYIRSVFELSADLADFYERSNLKDSTLKYLRINKAFSDTLYEESRQRIATEMLAKFDTQKKEAEILHQKELISRQQKMSFALIILITVLLLSILLIWRNVHQKKKIRQKESELQNANAMLRGQDEERERIARELHDRVGSMISTTKLYFTSMDEKIGELVKEQHNAYNKAITLLDETYEEVRRISHDLDSGILGRFGLRTAMLQLTQLIQSTNKLQVQYLDNNIGPELSKPFETDLYRITQELLGNTIKHAGAKEVSIQLSRTNGNLVYSYEDDGKGFDKQEIQKARGMGLKNIEARVRKMKGTWHLDTSPGNGLNFIIEIPLHEN